MAVMAHHESEIVAVKAGEMRFQVTEDGPWEAAVVGQGFCEIANNRVMLLADTIEKPEEIDRIRAQAAPETEHFRVLQHPRGDGESAGSSERDGKICGLGALEADLSLM